MPRKNNLRNRFPPSPSHSTKERRILGFRENEPETRKRDFPFAGPIRLLCARPFLHFWQSLFDPWRRGETREESSRPHTRDEMPWYISFPDRAFLVFSIVYFLRSFFRAQIRLGPPLSAHAFGQRDVAKNPNYEWLTRKQSGRERQKVNSILGETTSLGFNQVASRRLAAYFLRSSCFMTAL